MAEFKDRFSQLVDESMKSTTELAQDLNVSKQTISAWCTGARSPRRPVVEHIALHFNVSIPWLLGISDDRGKAAAKPADAEDDDPEFVTLAHRLKRLDPADRRRVEDMIKLMFPEDFE